MLGRKNNASKQQLGQARERTEMLHQLISTMMLQRKKDIIAHQLPKKEEKVVFCRMSDLQQRVYQRVLSSIDFQTVLRRNEECDCDNSCGKRGECCYQTVPSPIELFEEYCDQNGIADVEDAWNHLADEEKEPYEINGGILYPYYHPHWKTPHKTDCKSCPRCLMLPCTSVLTKISCHLELLKPQKKSHPNEQEFHRKVAKMAFRGEEDLVGGINPLSNFMQLADVEHCGKMRTLNKLIPLWQRDQHKLLIFSNYTRVLDVLESYLKSKGASFLRLDGSTSSNLRLGMCDQFNSDSSIFCFLISTKAGGVGLNLTGASRVVIFDPDWNPANDLQAQDRAFRIGQKQDVRVYRLISSGSIEEMKYIRQMYKTQVNNTVLNETIEMRYFDGVAKDSTQKGDIFGIENLWKLDPNGHMKTFLKKTSKRRKKRNRSNDGESSSITATSSNDVESDTFNDPDFEIADDMVSSKALASKKNSNNTITNNSGDNNSNEINELNKIGGIGATDSTMANRNSVDGEKKTSELNNDESTSTVDDGDLDTAFSSTDLFGANEKERNYVRRAREDFENGLLKQDTNGGFGLSSNNNFGNSHGFTNNNNDSKMDIVNFSDEDDDGNSEYFINENAPKKSTELNQGAAKNIANFEKKQARKALKTRKRRNRSKGKKEITSSTDSTTTSTTATTAISNVATTSNNSGPEIHSENTEGSTTALVDSIKDLSEKFNGDVKLMAEYIRKKCSQGKKT